MNEARHMREPEAADGECLWADFRRATSEQGVIALIRHHLPMVRRVVRQLAIYQTACVDMEDLMQVALMGLWTAIDRYDGARGVPFEAYALPRIRGAVHDALRRHDPLSRTDRDALKQLKRLTQEYVQEHGEAPDEEVLASMAGMEADRMRALLVRAQPAVSLDALGEDGGLGSLAERLPDENAPDPRAETVRRERVARFRQAFKQLPSRQQKILYLYYFEDLTLKEVGAIMQLTEARICQIHAGALLALRAIMEAEPGQPGTSGKERP